MRVITKSPRSAGRYCRSVPRCGRVTGGHWLCRESVGSDGSSREMCCWLHFRAHGRLGGPAGREAPAGPVAPMWPFGLGRLWQAVSSSPSPRACSGPPGSGCGMLPSSGPRSSERADAQAFWRQPERLLPAISATHQVSYTAKKSRGDSLYCRNGLTVTCLDLCATPSSTLGRSVIAPVLVLKGPRQPHRRRRGVAETLCSKRGSIFIDVIAGAAGSRPVAGRALRSDARSAASGAGRFSCGDVLSCGAECRRGLLRRHRCRGLC